jgi:hypothetical protein
MHETWAHQLETWRDFYLLIGTAGVTLTGLLFVVVSLGPRLISERQGHSTRAFLSPNAFFFTTTLVVSAMLMAPGLPANVIGTLLCVGAVGSLGYLVYTKAHEQWRRNQLPFLDWIWFVGLPFATYGLLLLFGIGILLQEALALHGVAAALVLLLVVGIRNAWDMVIWVSQKEPLVQPKPAPENGRPEKRRAAQRKR